MHFTAKRAAARNTRWIVDPIDGTQSFLRGQHGWCISIAYEYEGELVVGCVYAPDVDELFLAVRGKGALLNGKPIHVSPVSDPRKGILHFGYGHRVPDRLSGSSHWCPICLQKSATFGATARRRTDFAPSRAVDRICLRN